MKKLLKMFAIALVVAVSGTILVACGDKKDKETEQTSNEQPAEEIQIQPNVNTEEEFFNKVEAGSAIVLGSNLTIQSKITFRKDVEINLNGHTLTFAGTVDHLIRNNPSKTVTIKNGKIEYASEVIVGFQHAFIENYGNLTIDNVEIEINNVDCNDVQAVAVFFNLYDGVLVIQNSTITMNAPGTTSNYKPVGIENFGKTFNLINSTVTVNSDSTGSIYGVYNYIGSSEDFIDCGACTTTISGSTINVTSTQINSITGVFAESYRDGEDISKIIINVGTVVNVTRDAQTGSGKNTYALRAKGNAIITGASNAELHITDETDCEQILRGEETTGIIED